MKKYNVGLLIGRFQPFHKGHLYLLNKSFEYVDKLIIGIGSSNVKNEENFLDFATRKKMLEKVFKEEGLEKRLLRIVAIPDVPDDDQWLKIVKKEIGTFDVSIGKNEWTNGIFENAGITVLRIPYYKRYLYEGTKIRSLMRNKKPFIQRLPLYLASFIKLNK